MRFMMLVKASRESEAGALPSKELLAAMGQFNEEMVKAGVMIAGDGLQPSAKGTRVTFQGPNRTFTDGPFAETKELLAGFWMIDVKSKEDALAWASRVPFTDGEVIEVRQVFEAEDFPAEVFPPEEVARERALRDELQRKAVQR
jgi:hypothetical protein